MEGSYDMALCALSYLIASLAGFVAIEFATRMRARSSNRMSWLVGGSVSMGTGIWSMHFIGMTAFSLPVPISFDLGITVFSWVAAIAVSSVALAIVGYRKLRWWTLIVGAALMGAGICLMHYSGMWAMRMSPGIEYRPGLFTASAVIAVGASAAALLIITYLGEAHTWRDLALRIGAALIMGVAITGMHFTGMAAAIFQPGAYCNAANHIQSVWMPWPTTVASMLILGLGIAFASSDARQVALTAREKQARNTRLTQLAHHDYETGLPNRARTAQLLVEKINAQPADGFTLLSIRLSRRNGSATTADAMLALRDQVAAMLPKPTMARIRQECLLIIMDGSASDVVHRCYSLFERLRVDPAFQEEHLVEVNSAHCPGHGTNAQLLLRRVLQQGQILEPSRAMSTIALSAA